MRGYDLAAIKAESECRERNEDDWKRIKRAQAIWCEAVDPRNTPAEQYLRSRALVLDAAVAGNVLRYHPACPWRDENIGKTIFVPAVIAAFRSIDDNEITAIQRVAVTKDGTKISRRMIGLVHRAAVKLDPATDTLAIAEGVETAMAARMLGYAPAWALGSVGMISKFPVLDGVTCLRILGETGKTALRPYSSAVAVGIAPGARCRW